MHEPRETEHEPVVITERHGPVAHVILNRPSARNAADLALQTELPRALRAAGADPEVAAIVLSGRGPAFSAGGDRTLLDSVVAGADAALDAELRQLTVELLWLLLDELRQPVVTAVHGYAIGWGAGLVALSDLVVMEEDAYLQDPHGKYGLPASPGCEVVWSRTLPPPVPSGPGRVPPAHWPSWVPRSSRLNARAVDRRATWPTPSCPRPTWSKRCSTCV
mgnify:FL=1